MFGLVNSGISDAGNRARGEASSVAMATPSDIVSAARASWCSRLTPKGCLQGAGAAEMVINVATTRTRTMMANAGVHGIGVCPCTKSKKTTVT